LGADLKPDSLATIGRDVSLEGVEDVLDAILRGEVTGRVVVDVRG
jgi:hypothetical protein